MKRLLSSIICALLAIMPVYGADQVDIIDIAKNPEAFAEEVVIVEGIVTQYVPGTQKSTSYYILTGNYGTDIRVNTTTKPETNEKYRVTGILYYDEGKPLVYISEKSRLKLSSAYTEGGDTGVSFMNSTMLKISIGTGVVLLVVIILLTSLAINRRKRERMLLAGVGGQQDFEQQNTDDDHVPLSRDENFKTVKIQNAAPKTLKFIPGQLKITMGEDSGKSFRIAGFPSQEGDVVTIGRKKADAERKFSHIELMENTVSKEQAEIISRDGKLYIKNLSATNHTQIDGVELAIGESRELKPSSTIRTGEVEFQYII